jgi:hypothetical protein
MLAPGWRAVIIFFGGLLFYLITGDISVAMAIMIILYYLEFRKKSSSSHY